MSWVTVYSFYSAVDAHLVLGKLESEGIPCQLLDKNIVGMNPLYAIAIGGVRLQVPKEEASRAMKIIEEIFPPQKSAKRLQCPKCESEDVKKVGGGVKRPLSYLRWLFFALTAAVPVPLMKRQLLCNRCGNTWKG